MFEAQALAIRRNSFRPHQCQAHLHSFDRKIETVTVSVRRKGRFGEE